MAKISIHLTPVDTGGPYTVVLRVDGDGKVGASGLSLTSVLDQLKTLIPANMPAGQEVKDAVLAIQTRDI